MAKNRVPWTEQEDMMATSYENISGSFAYISKFMQSLVKTVKNGGGIVTNEDLEEALNMLKDMINKNLYNVSEMRVDISTGTIKPKPASSSTPKSPSPWTSSSSDGNNYQYESKSNKYMKRTINEAQLRDIVRESVRKVLNEIGEYEERYQINISYPANGCPYAFVSRYSGNGYRGTTSGTRYADGGVDSTEYCVTTNPDKEYLEILAAEYNDRVERAYGNENFDSIEHRLYTKIINS